ncbi:MAG TPA: methionyl-tRNA formyltransferase [Verrucomicrobiae bacterium]
MNTMRIIFMGSAPLSCESLQALRQRAGIDLLAVVTQPDRPKGRELKLQPSPVKLFAVQQNLRVLQPERARSPDFINEVRTLGPDLIVVAAYGQILPQELLQVPQFGCINVHTSLLPKYRGAAPIQAAILNDEPETGVTIMKMDAGLDTGDLLSQERTAIGPEDTAQTLHERLAQMGAGLLMRTMPEYVSGRLTPKPQPAEGVSYAPKIKKQDGRIDWTKPGRTIWNQVRGLVPWPGAFTFMPADPHPQLLKVWAAEVVPLSGPAGEVLRADNHGIVAGCGDQAMRITELQREGGRRLPADQFLAGHRLQPGTRLG